MLTLLPRNSLPNGLRPAPHAPGEGDEGSWAGRDDAMLPGIGCTSKTSCP